MEQWTLGGHNLTQPEIDTRAGGPHGKQTNHSPVSVSPHMALAHNDVLVILFKPNYLPYTLA